MGGLGAPEIILIIIAILILFGGKKIPELMKGLGKGVKEFKDAQHGDNVDDRSTTTSSTNVPPRHEEKTNI